MKRGEIYFAALDPVVGREMRKRRPVLIVSNDANNRANHLITIIPLTSNVSKVHSFEVRLPAKRSGLTKDSKAMPQQIRTISVERIAGGKAGSLDAELMSDVEAGIKVHLALA